MATTTSWWGTPIEGVWEWDDGHSRWLWKGEPGGWMRTPPSKSDPNGSWTWTGPYLPLPTTNERTT